MWRPHIKEREGQRRHGERERAHVMECITFMILSASKWFSEWHQDKVIHRLWHPLLIESDRSQQRAPPFRENRELHKWGHHDNTLSPKGHVIQWTYLRLRSDWPGSAAAASPAPYACSARTQPADIAGQCHTGHRTSQ